jgi:hypothetical protein
MRSALLKWKRTFWPCKNWRALSVVGTSNFLLSMIMSMEFAK